MILTPLFVHRTAKDIKLVDYLPEGAKLLSGSITSTIPTLADGSSATHTYVMSFTTGGSAPLLPLATVTYLAEDASTQVRRLFVQFKSARPHDDFHPLRSDKAAHSASTS